MKRIGADALGLLAFGGLYWAAVAVLPARVEPSAWTGLFVLCAACAPWLWRRWPQPGWWLVTAGYASLLAVLFAGANFGLDALKGPARVHIDVAARLGGLELWFVLCPGVAALGLAGWLRCRCCAPA